MTRSAGPKRRAPDAFRTLLLGAAMLGGVTAQDEPTQPAFQVRQLTTDDGSRFVLVHDASRDAVHWTIASWADGGDDPAGMPGLTMAVLQASLNGTWSVGSADPAAEQAALQQLDEAWQQQLRRPGDTALQQRLVELDERARRLSDPLAFRRRLAAAPAHAPEVVRRGPLALLTVTTVAAGLVEVASLLRDRREQPAMRLFARSWTETMLDSLRRHATEPGRRLRAEVLALCMPRANWLTMLDVKPSGGPTRDQALACFHMNQHPSRTVHVIYGAFDPTLTAQLLRETFATTALPTPPARTAARPRDGSTQRRSVVRSQPRDSLLLGFALPPLADPWAVTVGARWLFGDGDLLEGQLQRTLKKQRPKLTARCRVPWPRSGAGRGLLLLEVHDPGDQAGLERDVLARCRELLATDRQNGAFADANRSLQREWLQRLREPREHCRSIAEYALLWPALPPVVRSPGWSQATQIQPLMRETIARAPTVVEGRR